MVRIPWIHGNMNRRTRQLINCRSSVRKLISLIILEMSAGYAVMSPLVTIGAGCQADALYVYARDPAVRICRNPIKERLRA